MKRIITKSDFSHLQIVAFIIPTLPKKLPYFLLLVGGAKYLIVFLLYRLRCNINMINKFLCSENIKVPEYLHHAWHSFISTKFHFSTF